MCRRPGRRGCLTGTWRSGLGSELTLAEEPGARLGGRYRSAVGSTRRPQPLVGTYVPCDDGSAVIAFVVRWPASGSVAAWTARYEPLSERIAATWLLESEEDEATAWRATHIGCDVFCRSDG